MPSSQPFDDRCIVSGYQWARLRPAGREHVRDKVGAWTSSSPYRHRRSRRRDPRDGPPGGVVPGIVALELALVRTERVLFLAWWPGSHGIRATEVTTSVSTASETHTL